MSNEDFAIIYFSKAKKKSEAIQARQIHKFRRVK